MRPRRPGTAPATPPGTSPTQPSQHTTPEQARFEAKRILISIKPQLTKLHLDVPAYQQYWIFIWNMIRHQSLGYSFQYGASVRWIIAQDARVTGSLVFGAMFFWLLLSIPIGIISAIKSRTLIDRVTMGAALVAISAPVLPAFVRSSSFLRSSAVHGWR